MKKAYLSSIVFICVLLVTVMTSSRLTVQANETIELGGNQFQTVRKEVTLNGTTTLLTSTDNGLYVINDREVTNHFGYNANTLFAEVLPDLNNDGYDELLIVTDSADGDNILVYDTEDDELVFGYVSQMKAYDSNLGYYDETVTVTDYVVEGTLATFIAGYNVFQLDLLTGERQWQYEASNNMWDIEPIGDVNNDGVSDYAVTLQYQNIIGLSGSNGKKLYSKAVAPEITTRHNGKVKLSIWNLQYDNEQKLLYAAGEDGVLYTLNPSNGKEITSTQIVELPRNFYQDYYWRESDSHHEMFKRFTIELIDDIDEDGKKDIIFRQFIREEITSRQNDLHNVSDYSILFVSTSDNSILDELTIPKTSFVIRYGVDFIRGQYQGEDVYYIYDELEEDNQNHVYKIYSINKQRFLGFTLKLKNDMHMQDDNGLRSFIIGEEVIYGFNFNVLNFYSSENDKLGSLYINNLKEFINNDDNNQTLYLSGFSSYMYDQFNDGKNYHNFQLVDTNNQTTIWNHTISETLKQESRGYTGINYTRDVTGDGIRDIIAYTTGNYNSNMELQEPELNLSKLHVIDGKDGKVVRSIEMKPNESFLDTTIDASYEEKLKWMYVYGAKLQSYDFVGDLNGNGSEDLVVLTSNNLMYYIDFDRSKGEEIIDMFTHVNQNYEISNKNKTIPFFTHQLKIINDTNQDGINDFIVVRDNTVSVLQTNFVNNSLEFTSPTEILNVDSFINVPSIPFGDIDGDGYSEIGIMPDGNYDDQTLYLISSKTGQILSTLEEGWDKEYYISNYDVTGDGNKEVFRYTNSHDYQFAILELLDITKPEPEVVFTTREFAPGDGGYNGYSMSRPQPGAVYKDGTEFKVILNVTQRYYSGSSIEIYDFATNSLENTIILEEKEKLPDYMREEVQDTLGNIALYEGNDYFVAYVGSNGQYFDAKSYGNTTYFYDLKNNEFMFGYNGGRVKSIYLKNDTITLASHEGDVFSTSIQSDLTIANVKDGEKFNKEVNLQFENQKEGYVYVYVDDILVGKTKDNTFSVRMLQGEHVVKIKQIDEYGIETVYAVDVEVTKNYIYIIILPIITVGLFAGAIMVSRYKKKFPLPEYLREGSDQA